MENLCGVLIKCKLIYSTKIHEIFHSWTKLANCVLIKSKKETTLLALVSAPFSMAKLSTMMAQHREIRMLWNMSHDRIVQSHFSFSTSVWDMYETYRNFPKIMVIFN